MDLRGLTSPGQWLNDNHINAAMGLLRDDNPGVSGLLDVFTRAPPPAPSSGRHIQIHHVCGNHWVVSTSDEAGVTVSYCRRTGEHDSIVCR